jgi:hypothetical protein
MYKYIQEGKTPLHYVSDMVVSDGELLPNPNEETPGNTEDSKNSIAVYLRVAGAHPEAENNVCELKHYI